MREHKKVGAVNLLVDLLMSFVFHIIWIVWRNAVDNYFLIELDCKSIFVDSNLFDVVSASDLHSCLGDKMLDYDICHKLPVSVSFLVEPMNLCHVDLVKLDGSVIASCEDRLVLWVN